MVSSPTAGTTMEHAQPPVVVAHGAFPEEAQGPEGGSRGFPAGEIARESSKLLSNTAQRLRDIEEQHHFVRRARDALTDGARSARAIDERHGVSDAIKRGAVSAYESARTLATGSTLLSSAGERSQKALESAKDYSAENGVLATLGGGVLWVLRRLNSLVRTRSAAAAEAAEARPADLADEVAKQIAKGDVGGAAPVSGAPSKPE